MAATELLRAWLADLSAMSIVDGGDEHGTARANLEFFAIATAQDVGMTPLELAAFLRDAHGAYARAAARAGVSGWFYAWHDRQAGQLRMSACPVATIAELPFDRPIELIEDAIILAEDVLASETAHGVPWANLVDADPRASQSASAAAERTAVPVFARPL